MRFIILGNHPEFTINVDGVDYPFEVGATGPMPLDKRGGERYLGPRHRFWTAVSQWIEGGRLVDDGGKCVWKEPPDPFEGFVQINKRNWVSQGIYDKLRAKGKL